MELVAVHARTMEHAEQKEAAMVGRGHDTLEVEQ
jgi:hypothetical protein